MPDISWDRQVKYLDNTEDSFLGQTKLCQYCWEIVRRVEDVIWSVRPGRTATLHVSKNVNLVYGYPVSSFFDNPNLWIDVIHPEDRAKLDILTAKLAFTSQLDWEYRIIRPDQEIKWLHERVRLIRDRQGNPVLLNGISTDITAEKQLQKSLKQQGEREYLLRVIAERVRNSLDLPHILNTTVQEVRKFLQCDRVLIYRFKDQDSGELEAESIASDCTSALDKMVFDYCCLDTHIKYYEDGLIQVISDIDNADLSPLCFQQLLDLNVKSNLVVPILQGKTLWGLLIVQHCRSIRKWLELEITFLRQLAIQVGIATQQSQLYQQLKEANLELQRLANLDGLTQIPNRRKFDEYLTSQWEELTTTNQPISLILCDIDCFKAYNDHYGHQAGDDCLKRVALAIESALSDIKESLVGRYGGEEFGIILPNFDLFQAVEIAEFIQTHLRTLKIPHSSSLVSDSITLSIGISSMISNSNISPTKLIIQTDQELYKAKNKGRNQISYQLINHASQMFSLY